MKREHISDALNHLPDEIIAETAAVRAAAEESRKSAENIEIAAASVKPAAGRKSGRKKWTALAACLTLVLAGTLLYDPGEIDPVPPDTDLDPNLPMISMIGEVQSGGAGGGGFFAYGADEPLNENPWRSHEREYLTRLPVYKNRYVVDTGAGITAPGDLDIMRDYLLELAEALDMDPLAVTVEEDLRSENDKSFILDYKARYPEKTWLHTDGLDQPEGLHLQQDGIHIQVWNNLKATITFDPYLELPEEYLFDFDHATHEDMERIARYLKERFADLLDMENPQEAIEYEYNTYGDRTWKLRFYDTGKDYYDSLLNYNFGQVEFIENEGGLWMIRIERNTDYDKEEVGRYPLITVDEAKSLLDDGYCLTYGGYDMPGSQHVENVELIYHTFWDDEYYLPYYCFSIEVDKDNAAGLGGGLKVYETFFVPAIDSRYIEKLPETGGKTE